MTDDADTISSSDERKPPATPTLEERQNLAKTEKMEAEARLARLGWRSPRVFVQFMIGTLAFSGLLAAWGIGYVKPMLDATASVSEADSKVAEADGKVAEANNELAKIRLERIEEQRLLTEIAIAKLAEETEILKAEKFAVENDLIAAQAAASGRQQKINDDALRLARQEQKLGELSEVVEHLSSSLSLAESDREALRSVASKLETERNDLSSQIDELAVAAANVETTVEGLQRRRWRSVLRGVRVDVYTGSPELKETISKLELYVEDGVGTFYASHPRRPRLIEGPENPDITDAIAEILGGDWKLLAARGPRYYVFP